MVKKKKEQVELRVVGKKEASAAAAAAGGRGGDDRGRSRGGGGGETFEETIMRRTKEKLKEIKERHGGAKSGRQRIEENKALGEVFREVGAEKKAEGLAAEIAATEVRVVGKKEAFETAAAAGGKPPPGTTREQRGAGGVQNVRDVLGIALNPFSQERIVANVNNLIVKWGLETAANNPYTTALIIAGTLGGINALKASTVAAKTAKGEAARRSLAETVRKINFPELFKRGGGIQVGKVAATTASKGVATNTVTKRLTGALFSRAGFTVAAGIFILKEAVETYPFAKFEIAESMDKLGIARSRAAKEQDFETLDRLNQLQNEILNPEGWEFIISGIPWANIQRAAARNIQAAVLATEAQNKALQKILLEQTEEQ